MSSLLTIILIGISLSMDAFSLALIYGISGMTSKQKIILSLTVGVYHFFMPLIGYQFSKLLTNINLISIDLIASLILIYIGIDLFFNKEKEEINVSKIGIILFGLSVSIDSLTVGIGLKAITNSNILASTIFSLSSLLFTYLGLNIGTIIGNKIGEYSKKIGGIILIIIAIIIFIT